MSQTWEQAVGGRAWMLFEAARELAPLIPDGWTSAVDLIGDHDAELAFLVYADAPTEHDPPCIGIQWSDGKWWWWASANPCGSKNGDATSAVAALEAALPVFRGLLDCRAKRLEAEKHMTVEDLWASIPVWEYPPKPEKEREDWSDEHCVVKGLMALRYEGSFQATDPRVPPWDREWHERRNAQLDRMLAERGGEFKGWA